VYSTILVQNGSRYALQTVYSGLKVLTGCIRSSPFSTTAKNVAETNIPGEADTANHNDPAPSGRASISDLRQRNLDNASILCPDSELTVNMGQHEMWDRDGIQRLGYSAAIMRMDGEGWRASASYFAWKMVSFTRLEDQERAREMAMEDLLKELERMICEKFRRLAVISTV
jgi:hypothetical protein